VREHLQLGNYANWAPGYPTSTAGADCVMSVNGQWQNVACSTTANYVCERPALNHESC